MDLETLVERIAEKVLQKLEDPELRQRALRIREAKLADLRAFEEMYDLPRSIATWAERHPGSKRGKP